MNEKHELGGSWTEEKLKMVEKYLKAYTVIMNNRNFRFAYIDAFAGTGYREQKANLFTKLRRSGRIINTASRKKTSWKLAE